MKIFISLIFLLLLLASCNTPSFIHHTPALANVGGHTDGKQFTGRLLYGTGRSNVNVSGGYLDDFDNVYEHVNGVQAQGSYSVSPNFAIQASFMHSSESAGTRETPKRKVYDYSRNIIEAGAAYFHALGKDKTFFFELSAGGGFGGYKANGYFIDGAADKRFYNHNVSKFYFQPSVYWAENKSTIAFGARLSSLRFSGINTNYSLFEKEIRGIPDAGSSFSAFTIDYFLKGDIFFKKTHRAGLTLDVMLGTEPSGKFNSQIIDKRYGIGVIIKLGPGYEK